METKKLISGITIGVLAGGMLGGLIGSTYFPTEVEVITKVEVPTIVEKIVVENNTIEVPVEVETIIEKNITVEVPVDNGNLKLVLDHIYDNDGDIEYLTDDLDDDEVELITDRIVFINEVKKLAVDAVKEDLFDELDGEECNGTELDEDDMERLRVDDNDDELIVSEIDFEDSDAEIEVTGTFEQDDIKYSYSAIVEFKDGIYDELKDIKVEEE